METVRTLRQKKYKVSVFHTRAYKKDGTPHECGGHTEVIIYDSNGNFLTDGKARCSDKDNYDKKRGVRIALGRALDKVPFVL